ncbi:porin, partial [Pseudochrobactrum lubricantis]
AYGAGYFYIPGTETCLRLSGYVRADFKAGDDVYKGHDRETWSTNTRFTLRTHTASETELGTLKTFTENRFNFGDGAQGSHTLKHAYIQLGGLLIGKTDSAFHTLTGYLGDVINDDVVSPGAYNTNIISYTFKGGNGFSAVISAEQGEDLSDKDGNGFAWKNSTVGKNGKSYNGVINDYMPHVVG